MFRTPIVAVVMGAAVALTLAACSAPATESDVDTPATTESATPTPEALTWDGCPDGIVEQLTAGFAAEGSTTVVAEGSVADVTDPVVAPLLPDTSCVLNFSYSDAANLWTVIVAPDRGSALSGAINDAALAAGYTVEDYGWSQYYNASTYASFDVTTATSGADLVDSYQDVVGADLFPEYDESLTAIRIVVA